MLPVPGHPAGTLHYVPRDEVIRACADVDVVEVVAAALREHAAGSTVLPPEAAMRWRAPDGAAARSLAMPGALPGGDDLPGRNHLPGRDYLAAGIKIINGCLSNPDRGLARAQGLVLLFDPATAWPSAIMEAAHISALRTAAVSALTADRLARGRPARLSLIGCGSLARAHLELLLPRLPGLRSVALYDTNPGRCRSLAQDLRRQLAGRGPEVAESPGPRECVTGSDLIITTTTVTTSYLRHDWLSPGTLILHVSLDDVLPDVVQRADLLVVDDWELVSDDRQRLLGRLYQAGRLRSPGGTYCPGSAPDPAARAVDTTLGDILAGYHPGRGSDREIILSNPFGMSLLDIAVARSILPIAIRNGARELPR
ncbi:MAG: ornithine cyclodeaminase [Actinobacteria bacterium]|nr:ornithine cyclodeaminase [Actinomycetota bacterium]